MAEYFMKCILGKITGKFIVKLSLIFQPKVSPVKLKTKGDRLKVEKVRGEKKKKKKNLPTKKQIMNIDLHQHTTESQQAMDEERKSYSNTDEDSNPASLKVRIPKAGAYLDSMTKKEKFLKLDPDIKQEKDDLGIGLKLKVSKGKIISDAKGRSGHSSQSRENEENDSDTDNLVVDENPWKNKRPMGSSSSASTMKPGSLKLKLSFAGKALPPRQHNGTREYPGVRDSHQSK
ncbi:uncharacterized protein LOC133179800 [Saccostrea echinata]|uniref:uncharacterized protein LOC133179800 n=1 Tax=Saccostrea echinata TaxID=191078 RepID=UPI002A81EB23|nr:uncharacterized protein LOC133179800 [Saccostrea echinata]